tara:strand:+ start:284 stop:1228 length:945 start_codon:yes stop_codon:yes gene_type:complete
MKTCNKCSLDKEETEFYFRKDRNKYRNECKLCININNINNYDKNKEKIKKTVKDYQEKNKDKIKVKNKEKYEKNKEEIKVKNKEKYEKNKEERKKWQRIYYKSNSKKILKRETEKYWNQKICISCPQKKYIGNIGRKKFNGYCFNCFRNLFPNDPKVKRKRLIKQNYIHENIILENKLFLNTLNSYDLSIKDGCSKKQPDWIFDRGIYTIILECDENQHKLKVYSTCDTKRDMLLFKDLGYRPLIFIRFNPDKYTSRRGTKIKGCFNMVNKNYVRKREFERRKKKLIKVLDKWINYNKIPDKEIIREYLFFDGY